MSWRQDAPNFAVLSPTFPLGRALSCVILLSLATAAGAAGALTPAPRRAPRWTVSVAAPDVGRLYPGGPPVTVGFTMWGDRPDAVVSRVTARVAADRNGNVKTSSGTPIPGCLARWFTVTPAAGDPLSLRRTGEGYSGRIELAMVNALINQDACQRGTPGVTLGVS